MSMVFVSLRSFHVRWKLFACEWGIAMHNFFVCSFSLEYSCSMCRRCVDNDIYERAPIYNSPGCVFDGVCLDWSVRGYLV